MVSPRLQRVPLLGCEVMSLINTDDATKAAAGVVQHLLDRRQPDPELGHARRTRPPQIVNDPWRLRLHVYVERGLGVAHVTEPARAARCEYVVLRARDHRHALDDTESLRAQRHLVPLLVLGPLRWQRPNVAGDFGAAHANDLADPLSR